MRLLRIPLFPVLLTFSMSAMAAGFRVDSASIKPDGWVSLAQAYDGHGCMGRNLSPALSWRHAPAGTESFAVTVFDPDARAGQGWWHWVVINIPASVVDLPEDAGNISGKNLPAGAVQVLNSFGEAAYGGPCPPAGDKAHHYIFTVYALKVPHIEAGPHASATAVNQRIRAAALGEAALTARFGR